jgi:GH25 family lysozyme M1 (1,4-beta-N-acetylmuramidase)
VNAKSYSLYGSAIDSGLKFGSTPAGVYEYAVTVEAISYYIDSNGTLATASQNVTVTRRQCIVTDWRNPNQSTGFGIDVSSWNGSIDWSRVKDEIDFAILRIGFSTKLDSRFLEYAAGCEKYGIPYGVYHYSNALTAAAAQEEGRWVVNTLNTHGYKPPMGVWYDMEDETQGALATATKEAICRGFCDIVRASGHDVGFYGFLTWFGSTFTREYLNSMPLWVTQIDGKTSPTHDRGTWVWQYSWEGSIPGISGDVDCNITYANWPKPSSSGGSGGDPNVSNCTYYPAYFSGNTTSSLNMRTGPGTSHSIISTLDSGTSIEIIGLYKNTSGGYWYQINCNGSTGYVDSGYVAPVNYLYDDVSVLSPSMSSNLALGSPYTISGEIVSENNNVYTAYAKVYSGANTQSTPVLSASDNCNAKSYNLRNSNVDYDLSFGSLSEGYYTYEISAEVRNHYVSAGTLQYEAKNIVLWTSAFTVGNPSVTPPVVECTHNIVTDAAVSPTCTSTGLTAGSHCSYCNEVFTAQTVVPAIGHNYVNGKCYRCGSADPNYVASSPDYYLFGYINGANYACEEDYANLGNYKFVGGTLTVTFATDSYVGVKNGNNVDYYMTNGWIGSTTTSATLYHTDILTTADKLYVPGGKEITFTLTVNSNGTLTLSYTAYEQPVTPTVTPKAPSLTFRDEVTIDVHFAATDLGSLTGANMGLLSWSSAKDDGTVDNAESNVRGATYNSATGRYLISTKGIPAKKLGDTVYMKLYIQLANGSYVYSKLFSYSPKTYATNQLNNSGDIKIKQLMVAMLNYAAAAQTYFSYKPYDLANRNLTAAQKALVSGYSASMVPSSQTVTTAKAGAFTNSGGFSKKIPSVSFGSAFSIEYFFTPSYATSGNVTMYYWTQADFDAVSVLKASNASGRIVMTAVGDGSYHCAITGIAAKDLNQTIYVAGGYKSGSYNFCTGVLPYSIGTYCVSQVSKASAAKDLAAATAVYGSYANAYFNG